MKKTNGITLISLIITIIVLLILAGVTFAMIMGDNGIFNKANLAKEKTAESQEKEIEELANYENKISKEISSSRNDTSKYVTLWEGYSHIGDVLSESFLNFNSIMIEAKYSTNIGISSYIYDTAKLKEIVDDSNISYKTFNLMYSNQYFVLNFNNDYKTWTIPYSQNLPSNYGIVKILGINY